MMHKWDNYQKVDIGSTEELCSKCNTDLSDMANFICMEEIRNEPEYMQQLCQCKGCEKEFILHFGIFDSGGHIYSRVFANDINDENYSWQDNLTKEQIRVISDHLKNCATCKDRYSEEQLAEAWMKELMDSLRQKSRDKR